MRRPQSLRGRVTLAATATLAGWVTLATVIFNLVLSHRLTEEADYVLRARAEAAASTISVTPAGDVVLHDTRDDAMLDVGTWIFRGHQLLESPSVRAPLTARAAELTGRGAHFEDVNQPEHVRLYADPVQSGGHLATVVTSLNLAPYEETGREAMFGSAILAVLLLFGAFLVLRASMSRALSPVETMTSQAEQWSTDDLRRRFGGEARPTELASLARTLDALLDRLAAALRHEKQLAGEISHELRTPLARIIAETGLLRERHHEATELDAAHASIERSAEEVRDILETLLATARTDSNGPQGSCDALEAVRSLVSRVGAGGPSRRLEVVRQPGATRVGVDAAVLERALSPVLDNALRYATERVCVEVGGDSGAVLIEVRDDGPGIDEAVLPHVFEPGRRADSTDGHDGAGLGLALSRRLVAASGGSISATSSPQGACVRVRLPAG